MNNEDRKIYIDYLRAAATIAVIFIHSTSGWYGRIKEIDALSWWIANILNTGARFAVPVFVMISGAVLLGKSIPVTAFYRKRAVRLIPPIIFWSIVYLIFRLYKGMGQEELRYFLTVGFWAEGTAYVHLWYLTMFACLMFFVPFINNFLLGQKPTRSDLAIFLAISSLFFFLNTVSDLARETSSIFMYWHLLFQWYIIYFVAGYFFDRNQSTLFIRNIFFILFIIALGALANFFLIERFDIVKDYLVMNDKGIVSFVFALAVFLFFKKNFSAKENKIILLISLHSFGIYLVHPIILDLLSGVFYRFNLPGYIHIPSISLATFIISYLVIFVIRKNKQLSKVC